jgi:hypothetical protein
MRRAADAYEGDVFPRHVGLDFALPTALMVSITTPLPCRIPACAGMTRGLREFRGRRGRAWLGMTKAGRPSRQG